jgi:hypothetical protein
MLMNELPGKDERAGDLRRLSDPEFFTQWAAVRNRLSHVTEGKTEYREIKSQYAAVAAEYRRRINGGLPESNVDR